MQALDANIKCSSVSQYGSSVSSSNGILSRNESLQPGKTNAAHSRITKYFVFIYSDIYIDNYLNVMLKPKEYEAVIG